MRHQPNPKIYDQIASKIGEQIRRGILTPGSKMPSIRRYSRQLSVNPATVKQAYWMLQNEGLLVSKLRSGFYVTNEIPLAPPEIQAIPVLPVPRIHRMPVDKRTTGEVIRYFVDKYLALGVPFPDPSTVPSEFGKCLDQACRQLGPALLAFTPPPGLRDLRVQLARHYLPIGLNLSADDFFLTDGCMESLSLSFLSVANAGDTIAVESPCFVGIPMLLNSLGLRILSVPSDPRSGIDLHILKKYLRRYPIKACYAMPNFSNPSGFTMPDEKKEALVEMLSERDIPLVENDVYGDIYFGEVRPLPAKAFDKRGLVMLCSSFSKTVGMGLRTGWVVPGRRFVECLGLKVLPLGPSPALLEKAFANFLALGAYGRHLRSVRKRCAGNLRRFQETIASSFPEETRTSRPQGGLSLWVEFPKKVDVLKLYQETAEKGIYTNTGQVFSFGINYRKNLQLYFSAPWDERVEKALQTVGELAKKQLA